MPLILQPSLDDVTRKELEARLEVVRVKRMEAAQIYYTGVNAKLDAVSDKIKVRINGQMEMLNKEILSLDKALEKVEKRIEAVIQLDQEVGVLGMMRVDTMEHDDE